MPSPDWPALHPAADARAHLVPGLRSWADSALSTLAHLDTSKFPTSKNALLVRLDCSMRCSRQPADLADLLALHNSAALDGPQTPAGISPYYD